MIQRDIGGFSSYVQIFHFPETPDERLLTEAECDSVLSSIRDEFVHRGDGSYRDLVYPHEWRPGDFIISGTQSNREHFS